MTSSAGRGSNGKNICSHPPRQTGQGHIHEANWLSVSSWVIWVGVSLSWVKRCFSRSRCILTVDYQHILYLCHSELKIKPISAWICTPPCYLISLMTVFKNKIHKEAITFFTHFAVDNIYGLLFFLFECTLLAHPTVQ